MKVLNLPIRTLLCVLMTAMILIAGQGKLCANPDERQVLKRDAEQMTPREPSKGTQDSYQDDEYWRYDRDKSLKEDEPTVFDRMWNSFWKKMMNSFKMDGHGRSFDPWNILWILIIVTIIVLVILKVTNSGVSTIFTGKIKKNENVDATLEDVDIHSINYEQQILEAISKKDFRLAVRLWFLRTLKTFSDKELVRWQIDKTNSDYYYELSGNGLQKEFGEVSNVYDYIWYGEFQVDEDSYKSAAEKFSVLNKKVDNR